MHLGERPISLEPCFAKDLIHETFFGQNLSMESLVFGEGEALPFQGLPPGLDL